MSQKTTDLIAYLLDRVPCAGRTQIVKFLYLADLEARKCLGKPLTDLNYILYDHGPFDQEILQQLDVMDASGQVAAQQYRYRGNLAYSYSKCKKTPKVHFSPEIEFILEHIAAMVRKQSLKGLLDIVYKTEPVIDAKKRNASGRPLRMDKINNTSRIRGLELERVLQSVRELDEGKGRDLDDVLADLG